MGLCKQESVSEWVEGERGKKNQGKRKNEGEGLFSERVGWFLECFITKLDNISSGKRKKTAAQPLQPDALQTCRTNFHNPTPGSQI